MRTYTARLIRNLEHARDAKSPAFVIGGVIFLITLIGVAGAITG